MKILCDHHGERESKCSPRGWFQFIGAMTVCALWMIGGVQPLRADDTPPDTVPEDTAQAPNAGAPAATPPETDPGPVRLARFTFVSVGENGSVTWRGGSDGDWADAAINQPLRQGAEISTSDHSRAEIQFDDGSRVGMMADTVLTLQTLYSDSKGEFTEIVLNSGKITAHLTTDSSVYQIDTKFASAKAAGPGRFLARSSDTGVAIQVRNGSAVVEGTADKQTLTTGQFVKIQDDKTLFTIQNLSPTYTWGAWDEERDQKDFSMDQPYVPANIALCADDMGSYGTWRLAAGYGEVWVPNNDSDPGWRPYFHGHWTWVEPFGWTWVSEEPWGWAPYHYGSWVHGDDYGWAWVPGPAMQYWSPGVVSFYQDGGQIAWCPLAPHEVRYPVFGDYGYHPEWGRRYSIFAAAVYYPNENGKCVARTWVNLDVNRAGFAMNVNIPINNNNTFSISHFVPANGRMGGSFADRAEFGTRTTTYRAVVDVSIFTHGQVVTAPISGRPMAGWQSVRPTAASSSPFGILHNIAAPPAMSQSVFRTRLPSRIAPAARPMHVPVITRPVQTGVPTTRPVLGVGTFHNPRAGEGSNYHQSTGSETVRNPRTGEGTQTGDGGRQTNPRIGGGNATGGRFGGGNTAEGGSGAGESGGSHSGGTSTGGGHSGGAVSGGSRSGGSESGGGRSGGSSGGGGRSSSGETGGSHSGGGSTGGSHSGGDSKNNK